MAKFVRAVPANDDVATEDPWASQRMGADRVQSAFAIAGIVLTENEKLYTYWRLTRPPSEKHLFQDTGSKRYGRADTREPLFRIKDCIDQLWTAIYDVHELSESGDYNGRLNLSRVFVDDLPEEDEPGEDFLGRLMWQLAFLSRHTETVLSTGRAPSAARPVNVIYDQYLAGLISISSTRASLTSEQTVDLALACEFVLPADLRAVTKQNARDRLAALSRRGGASSDARPERSTLTLEETGK